MKRGSYFTCKMYLGQASQFAQAVLNRKLLPFGDFLLVQGPIYLVIYWAVGQNCFCVITLVTCLIYTWADPEGGTGGPDPPPPRPTPWNFGKNVLIGFVKWYWFDIAQHLCKIQS